MQSFSGINTFTATKQIPVKMIRLIVLLFALVLVACVTKRPERIIGLITDSAMVVSAHPIASRVGVEILRKGGHAVDAAIATQFALAVVYPSAGNLGGGGFMVVRNNDKSIATLDYLEKAPGASVTNMYLNEAGEAVDSLSKRGHLASGVPGTVAGLVASYERFGTLPWDELVQPAIDLALNGFELTAREASGLNRIQEDLVIYNTILPSHLVRSEWTAGDKIVHEELGHTLERIRDQGAAGFYAGKTADDLVAEMQRGKGLITHDDLSTYKAIWRAPLTGVYKEWRVISVPPPSSGGVAVLQLLKSVEAYPVASWGHNSVRTSHLMAEAERRAYADRAEYLGDPDFVSVPVEQLTSDLYVDQRMSTFDPQRATPSDEVSADTLAIVESEQTTHLSIVDARGNAVSVTTTLNGGYGSRVVVAGSGFFLNNEMDDFSTKPGTANMYGAIGGEANKIMPHKRMLSSMTPTILEKDGKLFMVVGTPGGTTIMTSVFQTILNVVEHSMSMQEAVTAKRFHFQWLPDTIYYEHGAFSAEDSLSMVGIGHPFKARSSIGRVDAILVLQDGRLEGGADPRGDDAADGY
jgi:gamma-glutamyltranspeptidase/glutathione hydrolase